MRYLVKTTAHMHVHAVSRDVAGSIAKASMGDDWSIERSNFTIEEDPEQINLKIFPKELEDLRIMLMNQAMGNNSALLMTSNLKNLADRISNPQS